MGNVGTAKKRNMRLCSLGTVALIALSLLLIACDGDSTPAPTSTPLSSLPRTETSRTETAATPVAPEATAFRLTILHNNDGESQLVDLGPGLEDFGGVARFAAVVQREKQPLLPAGNIRELDTLEMAPFANMATVVEEISRSQFKEILENAVSRAADGDTSGGTGRFAQVSGFRFEWSESGTAQVLNHDGSVEVPGTRVQRVVLNDGEVIVGGGRLVSGPDLTVATLDFLARGGDEYPYRGAPFTALGVSYQQALTNYIQLPAGLGGTVTAADYPEVGEGRIKRLP